MCVCATWVYMMSMFSAHDRPKTLKFLKAASDVKTVALDHFGSLGFIL